MKQPCSKRISTLVDRVGDFKISETVALQAAVRDYESKSVSVRGPFVSPKPQHIYLVDGWTLPMSELVASRLHQSLHKEAFSKLPDNSKTQGLLNGRGQSLVAKTYISMARGANHEAQLEYPFYAPPIVENNKLFSRS